MTTPISSTNSSFYDPNAQFSPVDGSAPSDPLSQAPPPREVTIPPVVIMGESGAQQLVKKHDAARTAPDCSYEAKSAAVVCAAAAATAAQGALTSATGVGVAVGAAAALIAGIACGKELRTYYDCKQQ